MTIETIIQTSRTENRTVTVEWTRDLEVDLLAECDDHAVEGDTTEYWGDDWRVALKDCPSSDMRDAPMMVVDAHGNALTDGLESHVVSDAAMQTAQRMATDRGESVWLCWSSDQGDEYDGEGVEVTPA